jgi:hypothetical protein
MHLLEYRMKRSTRRTFKITKFLNLHGRICRPERVRGFRTGNACSGWL